MKDEKRKLESKKIEILAQPNDVTCGPTCLHAIYHFYGLDISLSRVIKEVEYLETGGTLSVLLGLHGLSLGFDVTINVLDMQIFDPTWFMQETNLIEKLEAQMKHKRSKKLHLASHAYIKFLEQGGEIISRDISSRFLKNSFEQYGPILSGLSSTYLYRCARECTDENDLSYYDDLKGEPCGHFVVLNGYCRDSKMILVADPYSKNPYAERYYEVRVSRLINSILLGELTYDANLLFIRPKKLSKTDQKISKKTE
jgi:hypothetical protein